MSDTEHKPKEFDEEAFNAAVAKPNGWSNVEDPVAEIRRMRGDAAPGNAAVLREALEVVLDALKKAYATVEVDRVWLADNIDVITDALAAPPRNCDVGNPEEQAERFTKVCVANSKNGVRGLCSETCPFSRDYQGECALAWAQMPFAPAEGGAE